MFFFAHDLQGFEYSYIRRYGIDKVAFGTEDVSYFHKQEKFTFLRFYLKLRKFSKDPSPFTLNDDCMTRCIKCIFPAPNDDFKGTRLFVQVNEREIAQTETLDSCKLF